MHPFRWEIDANLDGQWQPINYGRTRNLLEYSLMKCKQTKNMTGLALGIQGISPARERVLNGELCLDLQQIIGRESGIGCANQRLTGNCEARLRRVLMKERPSLTSTTFFGSSLSTSKLDFGSIALSVNVHNSKSTLSKRLGSKVCLRTNSMFRMNGGFRIAYTDDAPFLLLYPVV
jgi:hypothetical protein